MCRSHWFLREWAPGVTSPILPRTTPEAQGNARLAAVLTFSGVAINPDDHVQRAPWSACLSLRREARHILDTPSLHCLAVLDPHNI
jgi:hypothetical protein